MTAAMAAVYALFAGISTYAFTSFVLCHHPHILHQPRAVKRCRHISHRGGAAENYENTMAAFKHAVHTAGTDMLELDCHLTKDRHVVVAHDSCLLRTTGHKLLIKDLHYHELPLLKTCIGIDFIPGNCYEGSEEEHLRRIPLLREVLETFPDVWINIDVKEGSDELIEEINKLIVAHRREKITIWGSFKEHLSQKCYKQNSEVGRYFSLGGVVKLYLSFYIGLLPFLSIKETHLEIPLFTRDTSSMTTVQRVMVWFAGVLVMRPALFRHLKRRGIPTYAWVLNTENDFKRALDMGVSGIMTDYPTKLRRFLDETKYE